MATYVNDLRLKEIATGDEAGTWGTSTNTNLELIAEAFSFGTEAITTNADTHTTTIADGSTDPGRSLFLKYTGTLDSACTITIGPNTVSKLWLIENATSGSQNIIIKQGSGATVTVPNGQTKAIYSDGAGSGAAMVDAFAHLNVVDLTVEDDLTITDDLTVSGAFTLTGNADLNGDLDVDGTTNLDVVDIDGAVDMASTLTLAGNADFNGDLDVDGTTNLDVVDIDGAVDMASTLTLAGNADFNGDLDVDGTTNLDVVDIDGAVDMASTLAVGGAVTIDPADGVADDAYALFVRNNEATAGRNYGLSVRGGSNSSDESFSVRNFDNSKTYLKVIGDGHSVIGHSASISSAGEAHELQVYDTNFSLISATTFRNGSDGAALSLGHSRSGTIGTQTVLQDGDIMGAINFLGSDGTDLANFGAAIRGNVDGTPGANDMPGRLSFLTTADGSNSPTERMRINQKGSVGIGVADGDVTNDGTAARTYVGIIGTANRGRLNIGTTASNGADCGTLVFTNGANSLVDFTVDTTSGVQNTGTLFINGTRSIKIQAAASDEVVFNESHADVDFRVESDGNANMLFVEGSTNRVAIGTGTTDTGTMLTVGGAATFTGQNTTHGASRLKIGQDTTAISQLRAYGADTSTAGIFQFTVSSSDASVGSERFRIANNLTFNGEAGTSPIFEMINNDNEDTDTGRETSLRFSGHRSGGEDVVNAQISGHHAGSSDNDNGLMLFFTNNGSGLDEKMRLNFDEIIINQNDNDQNLRVESENNANIIFVDAGNDVVCIGGTTAESADHLEVLSSDSKTTVRIRNTNAGADGPRLVFDKSSASQANDDVVGELLFVGKDSAGNAEQFAGFKVESGNVTSGGEDGITTYAMMVDGSYRNIFTMNHVGTAFNDGGVNNLDFRVESGSNSNGLLYDSQDQNLSMNGTYVGSDVGFCINGISTDSIACLELNGDRSSNSTVNAIRMYCAGTEIGTIDTIRDGADNTAAMRFYVGNSGTLTEGFKLTSAGQPIFAVARNDTTSDAANMNIRTSDGLVRRSTSSRRYKNTITDASHGLTELLTLRPVTYKGNNDGDRLFGGLIAEEVHEAGLTEFVQYNGDDEPDALAYGHMVSLCIKAIQEQQEQIEELKTEIAALKGE